MEIMPCTSREIRQTSRDQRLDVCVNPHRYIGALGRLNYRGMRASVRSGFGPKITANVRLREIGSSLAQAAFGTTLPVLRAIGVRRIDRTAQKSFQAVTRIRATPLSPRMRLALDAALPNSPRLTQPEKSHAIFIPVHGKDLVTLPMVIAGALESCPNAEELILACPRQEVAHLAAAFPDARIIADHDLIPSELLDYITRNVPPHRRGWVTQQIAKFQVAGDLKHAATLVIDADTVLLKKRSWFGGNADQLLSIAQEIHLPYHLHAERMWGPEATRAKVSFVTHHQLMQQSVVQEMFPNGQESLQRWLSLADWSQPSAISEYHSYGTFLSNTHRDQARWGHWGNLAIAREEAPSFDVTPEEWVEQVASANPHAWSVSLHTYL